MVKRKRLEKVTAKRKARKPYSELSQVQKEKLRLRCRCDGKRRSQINNCVLMGFYKPDGWKTCSCGEVYPLFSYLKNYVEKITCSVFTGKACKRAHNKTGGVRGPYKPRGITNRKYCLKNLVQCDNYKKCLGWVGDFMPGCIKGVGFTYPKDRKYMEVQK